MEAEDQDMEHAARTRRDEKPTVPDRLRTSIGTCLDGHASVGLGILYGSVRRGTAGPESDVDLAVMGHHTLLAADKLAILEELAVLVGRPIDLVDLHAASGVLLGEVLRTGTRIYEADAGLYPELLRRYLLDAADFRPYRDRILAERRHAWIGA